MNMQYSALEWKVTVFSPIYFPASSYPGFVFVQNNHGCLSVMQSYSIKSCVKLFHKREVDKSRPKQWLEHYNICKELDYTRHQ